MTWQSQFGWLTRNQVTLIAAGLFVLSGLQCATAAAQKPNDHADRPPQGQRAPTPSADSNRPAASAGQRANQNANRPAAPPNQNANRPPARPSNPPTSNYSGNANRPSATTIGPGRANHLDGGNRYNDRPGNGTFNNGARLNPRQQVGVGAPRPFVDRMRELTPQQRDRVLQSSRAFQNFSPEQQGRIKQQFNQWDRMTPQQRANLREKENTWRNLTPDQRQHIKNDVLPQWKQMPWGRQQVIQQKLGVLQNMPENARNQRLNDPNFTRGMNDNEKSMLHDLSHLHVGGAPDPPGNE